ncbi:MAG: glycosyltransferase family 4 protein [Sedimentisphaerales bacterium]
MDDINRISVCFVSLDIYPLFNPCCRGVQGGSEVDFYMIATELAKDDRFRVSIVTGDFGQPDIETFGNITLYKAGDLQRKLFSGYVALWKAMRLADADIYFRQGAAITTDLVALFCRLNRKSFFLRTATDYECNGEYIQQFPLRGRTYLWSLRQAKRVFVQRATDVSKMFNTAGVTAVVVPNGHRIVELHGLNRDSILWVGRTDVLKQPAPFIQLAKEVTSEQFVMICQKAKGDRNYNELVAAASAVSNLKFIEYVPFHEIDSYFQRAKVFVNTSQAEGFPSTFIQAGKCAVPILTLKVNPDGFLDKYNCGICCNGDMDKMATSLEFMLEQNRYIEAGENARTYVMQNHDISKIIELYKEHFIANTESSD